MSLTLSNPLKIIIVDDEIDIANILKKFFIKMGFDAIAFTDPLLALEHFIALDKYGLAIVDLRMPGMSGLDFANKIRQISTTVKIFLITAFDITDLENNTSFRTAQIERIIQKPIKFSNLKKIIEKSLLIDNNKINIQ
jgi:DNA-binding response OmpR family regulator